MTWTGDQASARARVGIVKGLEEAARRVLVEAQKIVPYDTGDLSRSGSSGMVDSTRSAVSFSDSGAVDAHERLDVQPANGRSRKYLEGPLNSSKNVSAKVLQDAIKQALSG